MSGLSPLQKSGDMEPLVDSELLPSQNQDGEEDNCTSPGTTSHGEAAPSTPHHPDTHPPLHPSHGLSPPGVAGGAASSLPVGPGSRVESAGRRLHRPHGVPVPAPPPLHPRPTPASPEAADTRAQAEADTRGGSGHHPPPATHTAVACQAGRSHHVARADQLGHHQQGAVADQLGLPPHVQAADQRGRSGPTFPDQTAAAVTGGVEGSSPWGSDCIADAGGGDFPRRPFSADRAPVTDSVSTPSYNPAAGAPASGLGAGGELVDLESPHRDSDACPNPTVNSDLPSADNPSNNSSPSQPSSLECEDTAQLLPSSLDDRKTPSSSRYHTFPRSPDMDSSTEKSSEEWGSPYSSSKGAMEHDGSGRKGGNTTFVYILACFATIGGLLFGYDTGIVSGSMLLLKPYFDLNTVWQEGIVSGTIGAAAVFALLSGFVCDAFGRKKTIMFASFVFAVGAVVMAVADTKEILLAGRIVVGAGIGFASMTVPVYVAEASPSAIRGRLVTLNQLFITIGILLSSIIAGAFSSMKEDGWRYMLGLACAPAVIQFFGFIYLPESPRWLVSKGREDEARQVLRRIRSTDDVEDEMLEMKEAEQNKQTGFVLGQMMSTPHVRKALFVGCGLQLFQQLCGINTVIYYSATILKMAGFPPEQAIWLVCVPFAVNFLATFIGLWAVERLGRRVLLVVSFVGVIIALIVLAVGFLLSAKNSPAVNGTMAVRWANGSLVKDKCQQYTLCEDCILNEDCGYCYDDNAPGAATCLLALDGDEDLWSTYGRCGQNRTSVKGQSLQWSHGFCPTDYTWMAVLGLALFVLSFAPGLGPMPWTINSEIYPMWARGTGNAIATTFNWAFNLVVSFSFLTLLENITKYGTFFLFMGICALGLLFTLVFVPETRNRSLEEVEELFMTPQVRSQRQAAKAARGTDNPALDENGTRF